MAKNKDYFGLIVSDALAALNEIEDYVSANIEEKDAVFFYLKLGRIFDLIDECSTDINKKRMNNEPDLLPRDR